MYSEGSAATIEKALFFLGKDHPEQESSSPEKMQTLAEAAQIAELDLPEIMQARRCVG